MHIKSFYGRLLNIKQFTILQLIRANGCSGGKLFFSPLYSSFNYSSMLEWSEKAFPGEDDRNLHFMHKNEECTSIISSSVLHSFSFRWEKTAARKRSLTMKFSFHQFFFSCRLLTHSHGPRLQALHLVIVRVASFQAETKWKRPNSLRFHCFIAKKSSDGKQGMNRLHLPWHLHNV